MLTGLFLGAGASFELGMPLVWDLTAELKGPLTPDKLREINQRSRAHGSGHPDEAINHLIKLLAMPSVHYESILGNLELQYIRGGGHGIAQNYHHLYSWLVQAVYTILYLRHTTEVPFIEGGMKHYEGIAALAEENYPLWVFSLNHDLLVECISAHFGVPVKAGFGPDTVTLPRRDALGRKLGELQAHVLTNAELQKGNLAFFPDGQRGINLLKIHGALDVFAFNDGDDLLRIRPQQETVRGITEALRQTNEELLYVEPGNPSARVNATNEIAYADEGYEMQFLRRSIMAGAYKFTDHHSQVLPKKFLEHFGARLNNVSTLICVGYGFGDIHINNILRTWADRSASRLIRIVAPGAKEVPTFLAHMPMQVDLVDASTTEFLEQFLKCPPGATQRAERAQRALVRQQLRKRRGYA